MAVDNVARGMAANAQQGGGGGGTSDYSQLSNKPSINGVELDGNKTTAQLSISYNDLTNKPTITPEYSIVSSPAWGGYMAGGNITPSITLPTFGTPTTTQTFTYTFTAATTGATFTAPSDAMLIDADGASGYTAGNSLVLSGLTAGQLYECSFACFSVTVGSNTRKYIVLVMKGYPVA